MAALAGGCVQPPAPCPARHVPLEALAAEHNANAAKAPRLWARARIAFQMTDARGRRIAWGSTLPPSNALLMLDKRDGGGLDFVLSGKELGTDLFRLGLDADAGLYYVWYGLGEHGGAWYGRTALAGAPGVQAAPIDPMQLVSILGVTELPENWRHETPTLLMTLDSQPCAYVVRYVAPQPMTGELKIWREVFYHWGEGPRRPFRVRLYDADGRMRMQAELADYRPIAWLGAPEQAPVMPTDFRMVWPAIPGVQPEAHLHMALGEMTTTKVLPPGGRVFKFWPNLPTSAGQPTQVDAEYGRIEPDSRQPAP